MSIPLIFYLVLLGLTAGSLSGLLGIGGGVVIVPALVFVFGLSQHLAQGTTLALMVLPIGLLAAWTYYKNGHVDLRIAGLICLGFTAGGYFGAVLATALSNAMLERVFAVALMLVAFKMLTASEPAPDASSTIQAATTKLHITVPSALALMAVGLLVGLVSGLIGIGGGVLLVPVLVFYFGRSQHEAQGTTLALMVPPVGLLAACEYYHKGDVNLTIAALICAGFFVGGLIGARLATRLSSRLLGKVFGVSMILIALKMLLGA